MKAQGIPDLTLRRLPTYLHQLKKLKANGEEYVTATQLSVLTGVHRTQIRKDIGLTGLQGTPKVGHLIVDVILAIESFLNWNDTSMAFLVGVGNLGQALLGYENFDESGIQIVAAFDKDPAKIGRTVNNIKTFSMEKFKELALRMHIHIGIITSTAKGAQKIADMMIEAGIIGIWNFTPTKLKVPNHVIVENVDLYSGLAVLKHRIASHFLGED